jgi:hypothetical protein
MHGNGLKGETTKTKVCLYHDGSNRDLIIVDEITEDITVLEDSSILIGSGEGMMVSGFVKEDESKTFGNGHVSFTLMTIDQNGTE